jgi:hypothetical protein
MPFPLALLPWLPAIAGGTGAAIKGAQRYGPQIVQGGINTLNKLGQSPWLTNLANRFTYGYAPDAVGKSGKVGNLFSQLSTPGGMISSNPMNIHGLDNIKSGIEFPQELIDDKDFWKEQFDKLVSKDDKKDKKEKKKETKKEKNEEPSIDDLPLDAEEIKKEKNKKKKKDSEEASKNLKKGGYVKKQRKRKHYKTSGFVKMKKSKKRKYIT